MLNKLKELKHLNESIKSFLKLAQLSPDTSLNFFINGWLNEFFLAAIERKIGKWSVIATLTTPNLHGEKELK